MKAWKGISWVTEAEEDSFAQLFCQFSQTTMQGQNTVISTEPFSTTL